MKRCPAEIQEQVNRGDFRIASLQREFCEGDPSTEVPERTPQGRGEPRPRCLDLVWVPRSGNCVDEQGNAPKLGQRWADRVGVQPGGQG